MDSKELGILILAFMGMLFVIGISIALFVTNYTKDIPKTEVIAPIATPTPVPQAITPPVIYQPIINITPIEEPTPTHPITYNTTLTPVLTTPIIRSLFITKTSVPYNYRKNQSFSLQYIPFSKDDNCYITLGGRKEQYGPCNGKFSDLKFDVDENYWVIIYEENNDYHEGHSETIYVQWDTIGPDVEIISPIQHETYYKNNTEITLEISNNETDPIDYCQYSSDKIKWVNFKSCNETKYIGEIFTKNKTIEQSLYVRAYDDLGNYGMEDSVKFTYR